MRFIKRNKVESGDVLGCGCVLIPTIIVVIVIPLLIFFSRNHYFIFLSEEDKDTIHSTNVLCDVGEAVIGAIYIDSNIEQAIAFVERNWCDMIDTAKSGSEKDFKTRLQEKFHTLKLPFPVYELVSKEGSDHEPMFTVKVSLNEKVYAIGKGKNKKLAEQQAAESLLKQLEEENGSD